MDRRSFLTAIFGIAGAAALARTVRPINAMAGVPGAGILDELETPQAEAADDAQAEVQQVYSVLASPPTLSPAGLETGLP